MRTIRMENHTCFGNMIDWFDFDTRRIGGHLTPLPEAGDLIISRMESGKNGVFEIIKVYACYDPHDQFFATVKDIGYENGEKCFFVDNQDEYNKLDKIWTEAVPLPETVDENGSEML